MRRLTAVIVLGVLSPIIALCARASDRTAVVRDLGTIPAVDCDDRLVSALSALLLANPGDRLVATEARFVPEGAESCSARFLYDRDRRMLLVMLRTVRRGSGDFYHRRTYPDTDPEDFRYRLPHRA